MEKMGWQHCKKETFTNKPYSKMCQNLNFDLGGGEAAPPTDFETATVA